MATILFTPSPPNQSSSMAAVNLCPDSPINLCSSPRISFSYILDHHPSSDHIARSDQNLCSNDSDFDFGLCLPDLELTHQISTADELFFDGVILPTQVKQSYVLEASSSITPKKDEEEEDVIIVSSTKASLIREEKGNSKSFWRFMRSSSLNSDECKNTSFWSSLPLLSRSNSTGSFTKTSTKHAHRKLHKSVPKSPRFHQKPPLRKAQSLTCGNDNPYIIKGTSHLLGFGSFFRNAKNPCT